MSSSVTNIIDTLAERAQQTNLFGSPNIKDQTLELEAVGSAETAYYRVYLGESVPVVELATKDRWLSGSIEGDLVEAGDKLEELIEDELIDLGFPEGTNSVAFEHKRSDDMEYVFRSQIIVPDGVDLADACYMWLMAYETCFRQLGDMDESEDDD